MSSSQPKTKPKKIGVLALQGCVEAHRLHIEASGHEMKSVRSAADFSDLDALILPGGESTTMLRILELRDMQQALEDSLKRLPSWGICAGAILMASQVEPQGQKSFAVIDARAQRNAYGRQLDSFNQKIDGYEVAFIRAPKLEALSTKVEVLACVNGQPVWLREGQRMICSFHPELGPSAPSPMHSFFFTKLLSECEIQTPLLNAPRPIKSSYLNRTG